MKIRCHRPSLLAAFQVAGGVIPTRTPKEILRNVKLEVQDGTATLSGTDMEIGVRYQLEGVEMDAGGEALLPAATMLSILREVQDNSVELETTESGLKIRAGQSEFQLLSADPQEYPVVSAFEASAYCLVPGGAFKEAIRRTVFAADTESARYALGGVLLEQEEDSLTLAATDSRRLAVMKVAARREGSGEGPNDSSVIPTKALQLLERSIDEEEDVSLCVRGNDVLVTSGPITIVSRVVEGRFPRYRDVIPKEANLSVDLVVGPFFSAVRQAQIVTSEENTGVDFLFSPGLLRLESETADVGHSHIELPISYEEAELGIKFNPRFVADYLRVLEPETTVRLDLIDPESAAVFRTDDGYTYVIMPLSPDR